MRPGGKQPGEMSPGEMRPGEMRPGEMRPGEIRPGEMRPGGIRPGDMRPGEMRAHGLANDPGWDRRKWGGCLDNDLIPVFTNPGFLVLEVNENIFFVISIVVAVSD